MKKKDSNFWKSVILALCFGLPGCGAPDPSEKLLQAVMSWEVEDARAALEAGANPNLIVPNPPDGNKSPLLVFAIRNRPTLAPLLLEKGADINQSDAQGITPLVAAVSDPQMPASLVEAILKRRPNLQGRDGARALLEAAESSRGEATLLYFLQNGADFRARDNDGRDALFHAASRGHTKAVKILVRKGLNPLRRDNHGENVIQYARRNHHPEIARLLRSPQGPASARTR